MSLKKKLWLLFYCYIKISTFCVGGGLAMLPVVEEYFVKKYKLISEDDLIDYIAITQSMPGIIAINMAALIGMKVAGILGVIFATLGTILPSFIIINLVVILRNQIGESQLLDQIFSGVRAAVTALILISAVKMSKKIFIGKYAQTLTIIAFLILAFTNIDVFLVIIIGAILGAALTFFNLLKLNQPKES